MKLLNSFKPGDKVRVAETSNPKLSAKQLAREGHFRKLGAVWTKDIYEVEALEGYKVKLKGFRKRFSPRELQLVEVVPEVPGEDLAEVERARKKKQRVTRAISELDNAPKVGTRKTRSQGVAPEFFKIEKILDRRRGREGLEFLVKWAGFPNSSNTWEQPERFLQNRQWKMLDRYLAKHPITKSELLGEQGGPRG